MNLPNKLDLAQRLSGQEPKGIKSNLTLAGDRKAKC